jgi:hypothetical protein
MVLTGREYVTLGKKTPGKNLVVLTGVRPLASTLADFAWAFFEMTWYAVTCPLKATCSSQASFCTG